MRHRRFSCVSAILTVIVAALPLMASAQTKSLPSRENDEGQVMVTVTPSISSNAADTWRFNIQLNTHVAPITQDIAAVSVLSDGEGHDERPLAWEGDPPGGHHRKGVLVFRAISPTPRSVMLAIHEVGAVPERRFTWKLDGQ